MMQVKILHRLMFYVFVAAVAYVAVTLFSTTSTIAVIERIIAPGYGCCLRCERPWKFVESHDTEFSSGRGMFPLCKRCWVELGTPEKRLPYYRELWYRWEESTPGHADWNKIEMAVLSGK